MIPQNAVSWGISTMYSCSTAGTFIGDACYSTLAMVEVSSLSHVC